MKTTEETCPWRFDFTTLTWKHDPTVERPWPHFDRDANPNASDRVLRAQLLPAALAAAPPHATSTGNALVDTAVKGMEFYAALCSGNGCLPNDYGGPLFLLPGLVIALYIAHQSAADPPALSGGAWHIWDEPHRAAMIRYIVNHQQADGGWGTPSPRRPAAPGLVPTQTAKLTGKRMAQAHTSPALQQTLARRSTTRRCGCWAARPRIRHASRAARSSRSAAARCTRRCGPRCGCACWARPSGTASTQCRRKCAL